MEITYEQIKEAADQMFPIDNMGELGFIEGAKWMQEQQYKWVSVEDRLPEVWQYVLTYVPEIKMICRDQYREFETLGNKRDFVHRGVTHWMPLPSPPTSSTT